MLEMLKSTVGDVVQRRLLYPFPITRDLSWNTFIPSVLPPSLTSPPYPFLPLSLWCTMGL